MNARFRSKKDRPNAARPLRTFELKSKGLGVKRKKSVKKTTQGKNKHLASQRNQQHTEIHFPWGGPEGLGKTSPQRME